MTAVETFQKVVDRPTSKHSELVDLAAAGWVEGCPGNPGYMPGRSWNFTHPDFPGVTVWWAPGSSPVEGPP